MWTVKTFSELSTLELFHIYRLRNEVFIVEQECVYQDIDDIDLKATHLMIWQANQLIAYCRIYNDEVYHIGRVIVERTHRNKQLGRQLLTEALRIISQENTETVIQISAQAHLEHFYESVGFQRISDVYLEDDIPHILMVKNKDT
ncbi:GNAT family N-acetyltransferase [Aerococcaceae bacterium DSM 111020]|nr:GNAT family N-acetyltransferase [Aerococcaceae bacterium DSM 111020]